MLDFLSTESLKLKQAIPLTLHPALVYLNSLGAGSRPTMEQSLNAIARLLTNGECDALTLNWASLRYQHTAAIRAVLKQRYAPATANKMLCALRRVLKEAYRLDLMDEREYAKASDLENIKLSKQPRGRAIQSDELSAVMQACAHEKQPMGIRDLALFALLRGAGLRRGEVVNLQLEDYHPATGSLDVRRGKGEKDRTVYLPDHAIALVEKWLQQRGFEPGPLICPVKKSGEIEIRPMTSQAVYKIVKKLASVAGVETFSPHDFRRTFCSDLLDAGVDIVTVQKLAGHASPMTTAKYDRRGEAAMRKAVQRLEIPELEI